MLSIANMNSAQAAHYHAKDQNYYQQSKETGVWAGKGAERLGLSGEIDIKQFERLCYGIHPSEERTLVDISGIADESIRSNIKYSKISSIETTSKYSESDVENPVKSE